MKNKSMSRNAVLLIVSTLVASWLGMQAVHEFGHCVGAWLTGGTVERVEMKPWSISQTVLSHNPKPLAVVWAGPVFGVLIPLTAWMVANAVNCPFAFILRFFAAFCLAANGLYLGIGSFFEIGDCGDLLKQGAERWQMWLFGIITLPIMFWLWHGQGSAFGIGPERQTVTPAHAWMTAGIAAGLLILGCWI